MHQQKQNPSYANGFGGQEKAAKIQVIIPQKQWIALEDQGKSTSVKSAQARGSAPSKYHWTPGPASSPLVTACPAAATLPFLGTQHRDSESPEVPCAVTEQLRADSYSPAFRRQQFLKGRGTEHVLLGRVRARD